MRAKFFTTTNVTYWGTVLGSKEGVYVLLGLCRRNPYYSGREKKGGSPYILTWMWCYAIEQRARRVLLRAPTTRHTTPSARRCWQHAEPAPSVCHPPLTRQAAATVGFGQWVSGAGRAAAETESRQRGPRGTQPGPSM